MAGRKKDRRVALLSGIGLVVVLAVVVWASWDEILLWVRFESLGRNVRGYPAFTAIAASAAREQNVW